MWSALKKAVFEANLKLVRHGLVIHTWGNVSQRSADGKFFAIKPSGVSYETLQPEDIVVLDMDGQVVDGKLKPSSDTPTHLEVYRAFKQIKGIAHTHSTCAVAFAQAGRDIRCYGTTHADYFHNSIATLKVLTRQQVATAYEKNTGLVIVRHYRALKQDPVDCPAVLLENHGPFIFSSKGGSDAADNALTLETVAHMASMTESLNPKVRPAPDYLIEKHYSRKHGAKAYYGQK